jgi:ubiquinone/menaquinone biosynthesis C-methylase UbiE
MTSNPDWTEQTFDQTYLEAEGLHFSQATTNTEVEEIIALLGLKPGMTILDLACGHGRHSLELARRGLGPMTGLDFSQAAIDLARTTASSEGLNVNFVLGDMRNLEFQAEFDVVFNVFNSLFYWDDATHLGILEGIMRALKPGGLLLLDLYNPFRVVSDLAVKAHPAVRLYSRARGIWGRMRRLGRAMPKPDAKRLRSSKTTLFDVSRGVVHGVMRVTTADGQVRETLYENRLYTVPEVRALLERAGFVPEWAHGSNGKTPGPDAPRVLVLARKPN